MEFQILVRDVRPAYWPQGGRFVRFTAPTAIHRAVLASALRSAFGWDALLRSWHQASGAGEIVIFPTWRNSVEPGVAIALSIDEQTHHNG